MSFGLFLCLRYWDGADLLNVFFFNNFVTIIFFFYFLSYHTNRNTKKYVIIKKIYIHITFRACTKNIIDIAQ